MHGTTIATLHRLDEVEWFLKVGVKDTEVAVVLSSWEEAIASCSSLAWENLCLEAVNRYSEQLYARSKERYRQWNTLIDEVIIVTRPMVARKVERVVKEHNLPKVFESTVHWDILHVAMEAEYADVYPPGFYAAQAYWYVQGHFPCGWLGNFPEGKRVIF